MTKAKRDMTIVQNLEAAMQRHGTNPCEVARRAGLNPTAVYDIISGKSQHPRIDTLERIARRGLNVPLQSIIGPKADDALDREIYEIIEMMEPAERRRFLAMARAFLDRPAKS